MINHNLNYIHYYCYIFTTLISAVSVVSMKISTLGVFMLFNDAVSIPDSVTLNDYMLVNNELWAVLRSGRDVV